jgi:hypothetical protein
MKEPTHDYIYNLYEEPSHFIEQKTQATWIEAMIKPLRKPTPEVMRFDGNPLNYQRFLRQFHAKVVINCDNDYEKMNYLEQLTYGEAIFQNATRLYTFCTILTFYQKQSKFIK